jgi:hypothetical protein
VLVLCTQVNMIFVMLLWVCIHTGQAWKICLATVVMIFSVLVLCTQVNMIFVLLLWVCIHTGQAWKICLATVGIEPTTVAMQAYFSSLPSVDAHSE